MARPPIITKETATFDACEKWVQDKVGIIATGDRRVYINYVIEACCRAGLDIINTKELILKSYLSKDNDHTVEEVNALTDTIYQKGVEGTAEFKGSVLVNSKTKHQVVIKPDDGTVEDVVYGASVYADAEKIYDQGYSSAEKTGIPTIDTFFKWKRGELTVLTGFGNQGKSTFLKFLMVNKSVANDTKWAVFGPEDFPAHEFYHDLVEIVVGADCTPKNLFRPSKDQYEKAYKWVQDHFFYVYPKDLSPTPNYVKSRFLQLIIKEKVDGCVIDPFNQLSNDYSSSGGRDDKYLETILSDLSRFALGSNVYMVIVAHPKSPKKNSSGKYDCPDVFDLAGGTMWNNKADNILVYHRPGDGTLAEFHSKKIRRQKIVGIRGMVEFNFITDTRRFDFDIYGLQFFFLDKVETPEEPIKRLNETKEENEGDLYGQPSPFYTDKN